MWKRFHVKCPLFLTGLKETWIFSTDFWEKPKYQISSKSVQLKSIADGQTDMNITVAFRNFTNAPKNADVSPSVAPDVEEIPYE